MNLYDMILAEKLGGGGSTPSVDIETLSVTANGEYIAPSGKAYSPVNVLVPNSYSAGDEGKVVSNGALVAQSSQNIDTNGTYDTTLKDEVVVDVPTGGGGSNIVIGDFNFDTSGSHDVTIPYNGNGYILQLFICPKGYGTGIPSEHWQNCIMFFILFKQYPLLEPTYSSTANGNYAFYERVYGASNSTDTHKAQWMQSTNAYNNEDAPSSIPCVKIRAKEKFAVYISAAQGSPGFLPDEDYEYIAIYSS